ncbi:MAG: MltA domain-containing protein, partial [Pseudomonadota bacterium]|nr:MltA domain-containing protein [Pseudomonadota bacterium]
VTMPAVRAWLAAHPDRAAEVMHQNASYVFFRELDGEEGPLGAQNVPLTPGRSLAVDRTLIPLGAPLWLDTVDPLDMSRPLRRLMVAQDTGGAIRGPVRGDFFWGHGEDAEQRAGVMKSPGRYYVLLPKPEVQ